MKKIFGSILMAVGILIAGASGLCSLAVLGSGLSGGPGGLGELLGIVLLVGGIPFGIGLAVFFGGSALVRQAKRDADKTPPPPLTHESEKTPVVDGSSPE
jgi:hypothetical protein